MAACRHVSWADRLDERGNQAENFAGKSSKSTGVFGV